MASNPNREQIDVMAQAQQIPIPFHDIPDDIEVHRQMMFSLDQPVHFTQAVYDRYFPYIDNVWCFHDKADRSTKTGLEKRRGACRFNRKPNPQKTSLVQRTRREGTGTCPAKFKLTVHPDGNRTMERFENTTHSHDLEYVDTAKRNSAVRKIIVHDFFTGWDAGSVLAYLRDPANRVKGRDVLREAGGHHINRSEISNVNTAHMRRLHPGRDPFEIKRQQDKYNSYITCSMKGCRAPPFSDSKEFKKHRQEAHGSVKHDHTRKTPCPERGCSRHKQSRGFASPVALQQHMQRSHKVQTTDDIPPIEGTPVAESKSLTEEVDTLESEQTGSLLDMDSAPALDSTRREMSQRLQVLQVERDKIDNEMNRLRLAMGTLQSEAV